MAYPEPSQFSVYVTPSKCNFKNKVLPGADSLALLPSCPFLRHRTQVTDCWGWVWSQGPRVLSQGLGTWLMAASNRTGGHCVCLDLLIYYVE